jgi:tRNA threonylcarbamoyladenosine biosynthesis protein TsaE
VSREVSREQVAAEGARLWRAVPRGGVVWLSGELGSGKTTLVQAVAAAAGAAPARSPTFALVHEYPSPEGTLVHVDCYRLRHPDEALDLDLVALARASRLTLIEWPERAGVHAPAPDVHLRFSHAGLPDRRLVETLT